VNITKVKSEIKKTLKPYKGRILTRYMLDLYGDLVDMVIRLERRLR
jgi:hypothetical protein